MISLLLACAAPPAPPAVPEPTRLPPPSWVLVGRASSDGLSTPTLQGGTARLGVGCAALNDTLHGHGPPCFVEEWRAGDGTVLVERAGARLRFDGVPGRTTWTPINGALAACLGDPLAVPPAADPGGQRTLERRTWVVALSGQNRCAIAGTLRLDATRDRADWSDLSAGGRPWSAGGREIAAATVRAEVRALVRSRWNELDEATRADALRSLAEDPDPDAARLLAEHGFDGKTR
ncbi:MAG: hypothetical protein Q8P41_07130 [Pseudomonadota bacterium]|nr:hypothetical protein [Pseudomonadota bacterium]